MAAVAHNRAVVARLRARANRSGTSAFGMPALLEVPSRSLVCGSSLRPQTMVCQLFLLLIIGQWSASFAYIFPRLTSSSLATRKISQPRAVPPHSLCRVHRPCIVRPDFAHTLTLSRIPNALSFSPEARTSTTIAKKKLLSRHRRSSAFCRISPNPSEPLIYVINLPFCSKCSCRSPFLTAFQPPTAIRTTTTWKTASGTSMP